MEEKYKISRSISWLILVGSWIFMCLIVAFVCTLWGFPVPKNLLLVLIVVIPSYLLRWIIVYIIENKRKKKPQTEAPLDNVVNMLKSGQSPWGEDDPVFPAYPTLASLVLKNIKSNRDRIITGLRNDGIYDKGKELAILACLLNKTSWDILSTGEYHIYRGVLNHQGESIRKMFYTTVKYLQESGYIDDNLADNWKATFAQDVQQVG